MFEERSTTADVFALCVEQHAFKRLGQKGYKRNCGHVISHLVNGQDPRTDHLCFGRHEGGHDQAGAVAEAQAWLHVQSL